MRAYAFWLVLFCLLPLLVRRPIFGLMAYCVLNITRPELFFWGGDQGAKSLIIVFGATMLGMLINAEIDISALWQPHTLLILWIWGAMQTSLWMATYEVPGIRIYISEVFKVWVLCVVVTMMICNLRRLNILLTGILFSSTFLAIWGIDQYFRGNTRLEGLGGDAMGDSNYIAAHFVLFMPIAIQRAIHAPNRKQFLIAVFCCLAIVGVILCTESRGGLLGLLAGTGLLIMTSEKKAKLIPFLVIVVLILAPIFITDQYKERVGTMTGEEDLDSSAESRLVLWQVGWMIFLDKPVFGCGFGNYPYEKNLYESEFMDLEDWFRKYVFEKPKVTHSTVFQVLSEGGLFLAIPFFGLFLGTLLWNRSAIRRARERSHLLPWVRVLSALQCGLIGYYVTMLFLNGLVAVFSYVVVSICAAIRTQMEARRDAPAEPAEETAELAA